jgi:hypothetical protein
MDEENPRKRQTTKLNRSARDKRIVERLREGFGYDEIAHEEKLTGRRIRQIVKQALEGREALEGAIHAHMQIDRLGQAMRVAGDALARGDVRAVAPFIKALEKLDRYQSLARETAPRRGKATRDSVVVQTLVERIRRQVLDECRREAAETAAAAAARPPDPSPGADGAPAVAPPLALELQPAAPPPDPSPADGGPAAVAPPLPCI